MRVAVLGPGAMGSLFGGLLAAAGDEVTLVGRSGDHVAAVERDGLRISTAEGVADGDRRVELRATTDPEAVGRIDLLLVFVKSYDTASAMADAGPLLASDPAVLTLQNGLGNAETIAEHVPEERVLAGTTAQGAVFEGPGHVQHAGAGHTVVGRYFGPNDATVERVAGTLTDAGVETEPVEDVRDAVWEKLLVNVGVNAATGLARVRNGLLAETEPGRRILERAIGEAARVARAEGRTLPDDPVESAVAVAEATAHNRSSMSQDLAAGRRTEIEYVNGAIVERAADHGVDVPVNETLTDLIRLAEAGDSQVSTPGPG